MALDGRTGGAPRRPAGSFVGGLRPAALAGLLLLGGCAAGPDRLVLDHPSAALYRSNGQPRWLPCMGGDALCTPRP